MKNFSDKLEKTVAVNQENTLDGILGETRGEILRKKNSGKAPIKFLKFNPNDAFGLL